MARSTLLQRLRRRRGAGRLTGGGAAAFSCPDGYQWAWTKAKGDHCVPDTISTTGTGGHAPPACPDGYQWAWTKAKGDHCVPDTISTTGTGGHAPPRRPSLGFSAGSRSRPGY